MESPLSSFRDEQISPEKIKIKKAHVDRNLNFTTFFNWM